MTTPTTTHAQALLSAALTYARRGWHVFPCHTPTGSGCSCPAGLRPDRKAPKDAARPQGRDDRRGEHPTLVDDVA